MEILDVLSYTLLLVIEHLISIMQQINICTGPVFDAYGYTDYNFADK